jgi:putative endonuclease
MSGRDHDYWVYIMSNNTRSTLYIGVTNDLRVRVWQHRSGEQAGAFSQRYHCVHLVYCEQYSDIEQAIDREKQLKGWRRSKKNALISSMNPRWDDLGREWFDD